MSKKTTGATNKMVDDAIEQQIEWKKRRSVVSTRFLRRAKSGQVPETNQRDACVSDDARDNDWKSYWFPILCAICVVLVAIWVMITRINSVPQIMAPQPFVTEGGGEVRQSQTDIPTFDIVRIGKDGMVTVAGRWLANQNISVSVNNKIVATEQTGKNGEFVYAPTRPFAPGSYTISLIGADTNIKSENKVFVYVAPADQGNSMSLLMTPDGSTILQAPATLQDGDLTVSKIDYLDTGRIIVTGDALPRLRVSLALDDKYIGFARVSDQKHYGLGADIGEMKAGEQHTLTVRLHDGDGLTVRTISYDFTMPEMTGDNDTFYTVRRGDCLWVIARNFLRRGVLFSIIAERNDIEKPDLIYPQQLLQIPMKP